MKPKPTRAKSTDPQSVFCEVCAKRVAKAEALTAEGRDYSAYFCGAGCYERWQGERAPAPPAHAVQEGAGLSKSRDERIKRAIKRHSQRDEPKADSVEPDELPPR
jgi:hypothetical protein